MTEDLKLLFREERAAMEWCDAYDRTGESQDNVANVGNHNLWLQIAESHGVTRQGIINGYFRVYGHIPYFFSDDDYIGV